MTLHFRDRHGLIPFRNQSLPFLTVNASISNQAFSHDRCNIFPGFSYKKANNTFLNRVTERRWSQVELSLKFMKRARVNAIDVTVKKDSLSVYVLNFFGILAGRWGSLVVRERD